VYVDVGNVAELKKWSIDSTGLTIGSGITISEMIEILNSDACQQVLTFSPKVATHMERIANFPVRNVRKEASIIFLRKFIRLLYGVDLSDILFFTESNNSRKFDAQTCT